MTMTYNVVAKDKDNMIITQASYTEAQFHGLSAIGLLRQLVANDKPVVDAGGSITITAHEVAKP